MKKFLSIALTALLLVALIPSAAFADALKIEKPEEMEYPTLNPLENSGEGFPTNSDPTKGDSESPEAEAAALKAAADSIGKTALSGIYSFVDASAGYNEQEGGASLWDGVVRTKWAGNEMPFINIAQLDGRYKIDGIIMATANDTASYDRNPMEWAIYASNDGTTWDAIAYGDESFFELTNVTFYAGAIDATEPYELVMFYSDIGGVSGFQISELVLCGERVGDSELDVNKDEANKWADLIEFTPGDPIANNGASYEDEAAALASIGGTSINGSIVNFSVGDDKGKTPGFAGEEAEKLWDSDNTTKYCSTYVPETSIIEMDDTYGLSGIVMSTANDNSSNPGRNPNNWAILGSNDLENWAVLVNGNDTFFEDVDYTYYAASFEKTGGYKYFAFENLSTQSGTFQLAEVVLCGEKAEAAVVEAPALPGFETADEAVASIGKAAIAGYTFVEGTNGNGGEGPENLWDGDVATKFCTGEFPISSTAELDDWYTVDGIVMATANDNAEYNGRLPSAWTVSGSADGENWTTIASGDESFFEEANFRYFAGGASSDAIKFVKFDAEGASSGCFQISELVLTGSKTAAPAAEAEAEPETESKGLADVNAAAAGKNVISSYEFISGSEGFGGEGPENLFDGETSTKFCTNQFPAEAIVKLDGTYNITGFTMATANDNADYNGRSPSDWTISVSADGENWTELAKGDDTFFEETNFTYYAGEGKADGVSYVKFNAAGTASGTFQVSELTLFGDQAGSVDSALDEKANPNTFDFGVAAAVAAVISLAGFAASKKKH